MSEATWSEADGCYIQLTASGPRCVDPVVCSRTSKHGDILQITKRTPAGPYDVSIYDGVTGLLCESDTFSELSMAKRNLNELSR